MTKKTSEDIVLAEEWISKVIEVIQSELEIPHLGVEEKDTLGRIVTLSVGLYFMEMRESFNRTTRLTQ